MKSTDIQALFDDIRKLDTSSQQAKEMVAAQNRRYAELRTESPEKAATTEDDRTFVDRLLKGTKMEAPSGRQSVFAAPTSYPRVGSNWHKLRGLQSKPFLVDFLNDKGDNLGEAPNLAELVGKSVISEMGVQVDFDAHCLPDASGSAANGTNEFTVRLWFSVPIPKDGYYQVGAAILSAAGSWSRVTINAWDLFAGDVQWRAHATFHVNCYQRSAAGDLVKASEIVSTGEDILDEKAGTVKPLTTFDERRYLNEVARTSRMGTTYFERSEGDAAPRQRALVSVNCVYTQRVLSNRANVGTIRFLAGISSALLGMEFDH